MHAAIPFVLNSFGHPYSVVSTVMGVVGSGNVEKAMQTVIEMRYAFSEFCNITAYKGIVVDFHFHLFQTKANE